MTPIPQEHREFNARSRCFAAVALVTLARRVAQRLFIEAKILTFTYQPPLSIES